MNSYTIYLAGGIAGLDPQEVEHRFISVKARLEDMGFKVLSPIRGKILDTEVDSKYEPNEIVKRDLWDINHSDLLLAIPSEKSIGTFMEVFHAASRGIPVVIVTTSAFIANHYWTRVHAAKIVSTVEDALDYLAKWYL